MRFECNWNMKRSDIVKETLLKYPELKNIFIMADW